MAAVTAADRGDPVRGADLQGNDNGGTRRRRRRRRGGIRSNERFAGWLFVAPVVVILGLFLLLPILMALWVSLTGWNGQGSPFTSDVPFVGGENYTRLFTEDGLARRDFMTSIRNNMYFVAIVVPVQTVLALFLAVVVNNKMLRGRTFFRTAFFFPSVTSSVAISVLFLFMFTNGGAVNGVLSAFGVNGPSWLADARGILHIVYGWFGVDSAPAALADGGPFGLSWWEWFSGPSVGMISIISLVVWTTSGTFMLMFLAALQSVPVTLEEAAMIDGATRWQRFRSVTLPSIKPTMFLVLTLGLIGTWQVFDQIYVMSQGNPAKTTLTPAFLSYRTAFRDFEYGTGAAISFLLFLLIVVLTLLQRWLMRERKG